MAIEVVTDRTEKDVRLRNEKGTYNVSDLIRVEGNTQYIAKLLTTNGYPTTVTGRKDWTMTDIPTKAEMDNYINNVRYCVSQFTKKSDTPELPKTMNNLDFNGANTIEKALQDIEILVDNMKQEYRYAGTFNAGEGFF